MLDGRLPDLWYTLLKILEGLELRDISLFNIYLGPDELLSLLF